MKKILLLSVFLSYWAFCNAQLFKIGNHEVGFAYIGPKVGVNFSEITNMDQVGTDYKTRIGYQFGAVGEIGLTSRLSFQSELVFTSKGIREENSTLRVNYVSIPLLAKLSFKLFGLSRVYATGGTYNNVRTNAKIVFPEYHGESYSYTDHYRIFDWGLSLGTGAAYDTKYGLLGVDLRYDLGITEVEKTEFSSGSKNSNRSLGVTLTFKYDAADLFLRMRKKNVERKT